jgi:diguanylate cyclase (GGDEF)-like protein/PAS domain S-box-containing protein
MPKYFEELLDRAYQNLKLSSFAIIVNVTVLLLLFYGYVQTTLLVTWYFLILGISILRLYSHYKYVNSRALLTTHQWKNLFYIGLVISSLLLGIIPFIFFVQENYQHQAMIIVVIAGLTAGAISSLSSLLRAVQLFLLILLIPLIIQLLLQNNVIYISMALLIFFYLILVMRIAKLFHTHYLDILTSREMYENEKEKLLISEERFKAVFNQAPLGVFIYDEALIIREVNQEFIEFLEAPTDFLIGLSLYSLPDQSVLPALKATIDGIEGFYEGPYTTKYIQKNLWISMHASPLKDINNNVTGGIGIVADITQRMQTQLQFEHQAKHDMLIDIPNRSYLLEKISNEIIRYKRHANIFGVIFLDLDHFKNINDSLGHAMGDKLLIETAKRLQKVIRLEDTLARLGGDEFVLLIPDLSNDENVAATKVELVAQKIHKVLADSFVLDEHRLNISSSLGIALISNAEEDTNDILKHADIAMYEAKKAGRNTTKFYKLSMDTWIQRRIGIENGLRNALANNEFEIYYQPIIDFSSSKIIGAEALLRWSSPNFENIYPDEFIPIAEESGLILEIGEWVLKNAVTQFVKWQEEFVGRVELTKIAVNISAYQFDNPKFLKQVATIVDASKINPLCLELELVESALVADSQSVSIKMQALRDLGIGISIDDFGTGYSSLSYLKKLPFTTLKIDKSFVMDIQDDIDDKELISAILMIAQNFNFDVVAEGVETYEQYLFLKEKECNYFQGYYCSRPIPSSEFTELLKKDGGVCKKLFS